jgi:hypothetical protein
MARGEYGSKRNLQSLRFSKLKNLAMAIFSRLHSETGDHKLRGRKLRRHKLRRHKLRRHKLRRHKLRRHKLKLNLCLHNSRWSSSKTNFVFIVGGIL